MGDAQCIAYYCQQYVADFSICRRGVALFALRLGACGTFTLKTQTIIRQNILLIQLWHDNERDIAYTQVTQKVREAIDRLSAEIPV